MKMFSRLVDPIVFGLLMISLILGAFNGMRSIDWALVTLIVFIFWLKSVREYRRASR